MIDFCMCAYEKSWSGSRCFISFTFQMSLCRSGLILGEKWRSYSPYCKQWTKSFAPQWSMLILPYVSLTISWPSYEGNIWEDCSLWSTKLVFFSKYCYSLLGIIFTEHSHSRFLLQVPFSSRLLIIYLYFFFLHFRSPFILTSLLPFEFAYISYNPPLSSELFISKSHQTIFCCTFSPASFNCRMIFPNLLIWTRQWVYSFHTVRNVSFYKTLRAR